MTRNRNEYFSGQEVLKDDLSFDQQGRMDADRARVSDLWLDGVVVDPLGLSNFAISIDALTTTLINVGWGVGYAGGYRIAVDSDLPFVASNPVSTINGVCVAQSSGNRGVPLASYAAGQSNFVWAEYLEARRANPAYTDPDGGPTHYPYVDDGYRIVVTVANPPENRDGLTNAVFLGTVFGQGTGQSLAGAPDGVCQGQMSYSVPKIFSAIPGICSFLGGWHVLDRSIGPEKLVPGSIGPNDLASSAVGTTQLEEEAVTYSKLHAETLFGDASDGTAVINGSCVINGERNFDNLTINAGATLTHDQERALCLKVRHSLIINGAINVDGKGYRGGGASQSTVSNGAIVGPAIAAGGGGGSGGTPTSAGPVGIAGNFGTGMIGVQSSVPGGTQTTGASTPGNDGQVCQSLTPLFFGDVIAVSYSPAYFPGGGGGGGGAGSGGGQGIYGGAGGNGGGLVIIEAQSLTIGPSGSITANGVTGARGFDGFSPASSDGGAGGGGGGGGGGTIVVRYRSLVNGGSICAAGGVGGSGGSGFSGGGNGGKGAKGLDGIIAMARMDNRA